MGKICVHHRSRLEKKKYKFIDCFRRLNNFGYIVKIVYDPNRTCFLGLICYDNGLFSYISITEDVNIGDRLYSGPLLNSSNPGSSCLLSVMPLFSIINNIESIPYTGFKFVKSAGNSALLINKKEFYIQVKMKTGWICNLNHNCMAVFGIVSNSRHKFDIIGKAGKNRALGFRPSVRGVAKNPCDHPHGGGEGKKSPPVSHTSMWGRIHKGVKTRSRKKKRLIFLR